MAKPKGSTVIITFMYLTWVAYLFAMVYVYLIVGEWFPSEVTLATAALFIAETVSLARLKMAKEGQKVEPKKANSFLEQMGLYNVPDFEDDVQRIVNAKHAEKEDVADEQVS